MSAIPIASSMAAGKTFGFDDPLSTSDGWVARYGDQEVNQFRGAELIAEEWESAAKRWRRLQLNRTGERFMLRRKADLIAKLCRSLGYPPTRDLVSRICPRCGRFLRCARKVS